LDYGLICKSIKKILLSRHYELIETVVWSVGAYIMSHQSVNSATVEIDKPEVLIDNIESISVSKTFIR
jgi:dihydroneopterin aldolase